MAIQNMERIGMVRREPAVVRQPVVHGLEANRIRSAYQAYAILHWAFVVLPLVAGLDKFTNWLVNWEHYLSPVARQWPIGSSLFMSIVGVAEIAAAALVAFKPRVGAYVVAAWLFAIIVNLLMIPGYFDIALRDFGLALGALALARLSRLPASST